VKVKALELLVTIAHIMLLALLTLPAEIVRALFVVPPDADKVNAVLAVAAPEAVMLAPLLVLVVPEFVTEINNPCTMAEAVPLAPELLILTRL